MKKKTIVIYISLIIQSSTHKRFWFPLWQFSSRAEPIPASLHDFGLDLLGGHDHQRCGVREGGEVEGNHEDHGSQYRNSVAQLVYQQRSSLLGFCRSSYRAAPGEMTLFSVPNIICSELQQTQMLILNFSVSPSGVIYYHTAIQLWSSSSSWRSPLPPSCSVSSSVHSSLRPTWLLPAVESFTSASICLMCCVPPGETTSIQHTES